MGGPDRLWLILLISAVLLSPLFIAMKGMQARKAEQDAMRKRVRPVATAVAAALGFKLTEDDPDFGSDGWTLTGLAHGHAVRLQVFDRAATLRVSTEEGTPHPWDLAREVGFAARGGMVNDPDDPYEKLDAGVLGEGFMARGPDAAELAEAMPGAARELVRADTNARVVGGWLVVSWAASATSASESATATELVRWARKVLAAFAPLESPPAGDAPEG